MTRNDLDAILARQAQASAVYINEGTFPASTASIVGMDVTNLVAEIRELRAGRSHVDNPVQNDPESFAVDNATRVDDPTDDAGYDLSFCGRGPCCLPDGHPGRCQM